MSHGIAWAVPSVRMSLGIFSVWSCVTGMVARGGARWGDSRAVCSVVGAAEKGRLKRWNQPGDKEALAGMAGW